MPANPFRLQLPYDLYEDMVRQAVAELPNECCGLLAGRLEDTEDAKRLGRVHRRYPLINEAASGREFVADSRGLFAAIKDMRLFDVELLAIYHSHPTSDPIPSRTDLERNYWPDVVNLIISLKDGTPRVRGWWLGETDYAEADWLLE